MKALIQRVTSASVTVEGEVIGAIDAGLLVFLGVEREDDQAAANKLLQKVLGYRVFADSDDKMNRSVQDTNGGVLIVSQFTLAADTGKGKRPSFASAAPPELAQDLYNYFCGRAEQQHLQVATGRFGADMKVQLLNDGPVTFLLEA